ncbi:MAG TPA: DNA primase [Candidatus Aquilonibacter sp.]|nr:DNA primase [Candidatus Aquilonibacter sp.]
MAGFSSATLERIRAASDIVDVIGGYLPLKKAGANFTALCPFHKEKTPSFNVNPHKQIFHCFGCHKGGDVFTFVKEFENIGFVDAVRRLAERAKIPLEFENNPAAQESRHLKDHLLDIHEKITQRWQNCLLNEAAGQTARDYLAKRGVGADAVKLFRLGAAPESWDDTVNWAKGKNYDLPLVEKAGLILRKENAEHFYDRFRGRLIFPICDEQGRVVGFSGRVLSGDEKTAKYVNSPETPIFTKSKIFFGLDKSKRAILDAGFAIICEGQLDLIACFMAGVQNVVAPQGTAFTEQHARILKRYVGEVVLCFDSDEAGQNAAVRSLNHLLVSGLAVRVAVVPAPHDPDSFIKKFGGEKFQELINNTDGFFDYYLNRLCAQNDANSDKGRLAILRAMAEAVHKTGSAVLIDTYAQKTAQKLGVHTESVRAEFKKSLTQTNPQVAMEEESTESAGLSKTVRPSPLEFQFLKFVLETDEFIDWLEQHMDLKWISSEIVREIVGRRMELSKSKKWSGISAFLTEFENDNCRQIVTEVLTGELVERGKDGTRTILRKQENRSNEQFPDIVLKLRNQFLDKQITALASKVNQGIASKEETDSWLAMRSLRRSPLSTS